MKEFPLRYIFIGIIVFFLYRERYRILQIVLGVLLIQQLLQKNPKVLEKSLGFLKKSQDLVQS